MKKNVLFIAIVAGFMGSSCDSTKSTTGKDKVNSVENVPGEAAGAHKVPFIEADRYFVKNTYKNDQVENLKITSQEEFDKVFGMAATMGEGGMPTKIDFTRQYVIAIIGTVTNKKTDITVDSLVQTNKGIVLHYAFTTGEELSFTIQPSLLLAVDSSYSGDLIFEKK